MGTSRKPRCFIAIAFDHDDMDVLYERAILPVLKANGIIPVIINRREDNRDINHQIIDQLNACDFCVTDLTYARPSVYFEAGYAQKAVEVIYTVRSDHLGKNQPDDLRVHFDLQMKPLIKWTTLNDRSFPMRLERRIRSTFLRRWNQSQKKKEMERQQRETFAHMPLSTRIAKLRVETISIIRNLGFSKLTSLNMYTFYGPFSERGSNVSLQSLAQLARFGWIMAEQQDKELLHVALVHIDESLTLKELREVFGKRFLSLNSYYVPHIKFLKIDKEQSPVGRTIEHLILGSIRPVPQSRIMSAIPSLSWDSANSRYWTEMMLQDSKLPVSRTVYMHLIDRIESLPEFRSRLKSVAEQINSNQQQPARRR